MSDTPKQATNNKRIPVEAVMALAADEEELGVIRFAKTKETLRFSCIFAAPVDPENLTHFQEVVIDCLSNLNVFIDSKYTEKLAKNTCTCIKGDSLAASQYHGTACPLYAPAPTK